MNERKQIKESSGHTQMDCMEFDPLVMYSASANSQKQKYLESEHQCGRSDSCGLRGKQQYRTAFHRRLKRLSNATSRSSSGDVIRGVHALLSSATGSCNDRLGLRLL